MALKALIESLDGIPEPDKAYYKQLTEGDQNGKFILDVESAEGFVLENVDGLRNALTSTKAELDAAKSAVDGYKGLPAPKAVADKLKKLERLEKLDPEKEADRLAEIRLETQIADLNKKHDGEVTIRDGRITTLTSQVETLLIDSEAATAIAKHKGDPELLLPFIRPRLKMEEADGRFSVKVLNEKGDQEYAIRENKAVPASIEDLVARFKANPKFGAFFAASGNAGGGARPGAQGPGGNAKSNPWVKATFNLTEQMRITRSDPSLAAAMQQQAGA